MFERNSKKNKREYKMVWYYRVTYQISILNMKQFSGPFFFVCVSITTGIISLSFYVDTV